MKNSCHYFSSLFLNIPICFSVVILFSSCSTLDQAIVLHEQLDTESLIVVLDGDVSLELVKIKKGDFIMGSSSLAGEGVLEETPHRVMLTRDYWIGRFEVTESQYDAVTKWPRCTHNGCGRRTGRGKEFFFNATFPVGCVNWREAMRFCVFLNRQEEAQKRLPDGYMFMLPTEAQWEYACRAGNSSGQHRRENGMAQIGWFKENSKNMIHPVGQKEPNAWGLYDMQGNLSEWCLDTVEDDYFCDFVSDPLAFSESSYHILRGGSAFDSMSVCTCGGRWFGNEALRGKVNYGFRVALVTIPPGNDNLRECLKGNGLSSAD